MAWIYLAFAGVLEMGWPVGLKIAQGTEQRLLSICIAVMFMAGSGFYGWHNVKYPFAPPMLSGQV